MAGRHHPELATLVAFGLGRLSEADSLGIELHVAHCDECLHNLAEVPNDDLVNLLKASAAETSSGSEGETELSFPALRIGQPKGADLPFPKDLDGHPRYLLLEPVGIGGMGTVFRARHRLMDRIVAVKIIHPRWINKTSAVDRFMREVRAAAQLIHPHIVTAYDAEKVGDTHLLVMEYVEGQTLADVLAEKRELPIATACEYVRQAAVGLQHALDQGMVHRDIKPQNLMLTHSGDIKILDFGLARFFREQGGPVGATEDGTLMGSPDYMAPEQGQDAHSADTRADIYGLGCTLYHLLAGRVPFPATSLLGKLEAHRDQPAIALHHLRPAVPVALSQLVAKMMAKEPADRYPSPAEVVAALHPFTSAARPHAASPPHRSSLLESHAEPQPGSKPGSQREAPRRFDVRRKPLLLVTVAAGLLVAGIACWLAPRRLRIDRPVVALDHPQPGFVAKSRTRSGIPPPRAIAPFTSEEARTHQLNWAQHLGIPVETTNSIGAKMILIPPGEFQMGSSDEQVEAGLKLATETGAQRRAHECIRNRERPQRQVVIPHPFQMGATEVTIEQFRTFALATGYKTGAEKSPQATSFYYKRRGISLTDDSPAAVIRWEDAVAFCQWLSAREQVVYRLPTEAEWEYACRSGTVTQFSFGDDHNELQHYAWYRSSPGKRLNPVGKKRPNAFGMFDMHGNVHEFCQDLSFEPPPQPDPNGPTAGPYHIIRGGSWNDSAAYCRSAFRQGPPVVSSDNFGFRVCCEVAP